MVAWRKKALKSAKVCPFTIWNKSTNHIIISYFLYHISLHNFISCFRSHISHHFSFIIHISYLIISYLYFKNKLNICHPSNWIDFWKQCQVELYNPAKKRYWEWDHHLSFHSSFTNHLSSQLISNIISFHLLF